jgi:predicted flavoprotein YhiN
MIYDIAIIGAGASGLMTASHLQNQKVCLIDKNPNIGAKIKISGGSKCNITNKYLNHTHYLGNKEFIKQILNSWTQYDLLNMLQENNIPFSLDEKIVKGTYFCQKSADIINLFSTKINKTKLYLQTTVEDV